MGVNAGKEGVLLSFWNAWLPFQCQLYGANSVATCRAGHVPLCAGLSLIKGTENSFTTCPALCLLLPPPPWLLVQGPKRRVHTCRNGLRTSNEGPSSHRQQHHLPVTITKPQLS